LFRTVSLYAFVVKGIFILQSMALIACFVLNYWTVLNEYCYFVKLLFELVEYQTIKGMPAHFAQFPEQAFPLVMARPRRLIIIFLTIPFFSYYG
jgi:hypothetical protein